MSPIRERSRIRRHLVVALGVLGLTVGALAAVAAPSEAATAPQLVGFSVAPSFALASTPVTATFTVSNPATNTGSVVAFTIVVPAGVPQPVTAGSVTPPAGSWGELVLSCGSQTSCSSLVLVYARYPFTTSSLKPGSSLTASLGFQAPSTSTVLAFRMIGIGGSGLFATTDKPTITIEAAIAGGGVQAVLTPGTPATLSDPACIGTLGTGGTTVCGTSQLPNGANGLVSLQQQSCALAHAPAPCGTGAFVTAVTGDFGTPPTGLYDNVHPASIRVTCAVTACPDTTEGEGGGDFATDLSSEEITEAILLYPGYAQSSAGESSWAQLAACAPGNTVPSGSLFCSDHTSYALDSSGNLSFTVFFLTDPKTHP